MSASLRFAAALVGFLCLAGTLPGADEPLSREEVARRAKPATALVDAKPTFGSGFCVHASGLFVTNEHVLSQGIHTEELSLVLDAGLKTQRVLKAKVLRRDKQSDLALLKVDGGQELPALALGSDKDLVELAELIAFGFPFGPALARKGEYPAISVNVGSVTSLRRDKDGELFRIQLDAALNPGNSGGPVLDRNGKVVGVVVGGVRGASGLNMAIPVSHVRRFLARPEILFTPPAVKGASRHEPCEFTAKALSVLPAADPLDLELILGAGAGKQRRYPMKFADGSYRATAVPFPAQEAPSVFRVEVKYEDGAVSGMVEDRPFTVHEKAVKLSEVRSLRLGSKSEVRLTTGQTLAGSPAGLDALPVKVGRQSLRLDLTGAVEVLVEAPEEVAAVSCTVVARQAGREVGRLSVPLYLESAGQSTLEALRDGKFIKPPRSGGPVSSLRVVSTPGDYIGQGKSYSYGGEELVVRRSDRGVQVTVGNFGGWRLELGAPRGRFLEVGEYLGAKRYAFSDDAPGIDFGGYGRGSNRIAGKFVVWELEVKGNEIVRLAIDFIQRSEETGPPLYGTLRVNSTFH